MNAKYPVITSESLPDFLQIRPFTVIHLDADWDGYRRQIQLQIESIMDSLSDVSFGYMDVDRSADFASSIALRNTPACAYYSESKLVAVVIGVKQQIVTNVELLRLGKTPDTSNLISRL
jgi:hypothetical protein